LFNRVAFGTLKTRHIDRFSDLNRREAAILVSLLIPMIILGVSSNFVVDFLHLPVKEILIIAAT
jgi:NADH:ubiquinone oxidoreductase subunit 4 (subunit M)